MIDDRMKKYVPEFKVSLIIQHRLKISSQYHIYFVCFVNIILTRYKKNHFPIDQRLPHSNSASRHRSCEILNIA